MKGIILAGGSGTRLYPLTKIISKQLLPIYDKPMIFYPLSVLMLADIREIIIISTPKDLPLYKELLGDGSDFGMTFHYVVQAKPEGLAQAFILAKDYIQDDEVCLILGDNIFYGNGFSSILKRIKNEVVNNGGAYVFAKTVANPSSFGVAELDNNKVISLEEKPKEPKSNYAVLGLYFYDRKVVDYALSLKPSKRNELEITDLNKLYLKENNLSCELLGRGFAWLDTGTIEDLFKASEFIKHVSDNQSLKISCIEEIAYNNGWINLEQFKKAADKYSNSSYGSYIKDLIGGIK